MRQLQPHLYKTKIIDNFENYSIRSDGVIKNIKTSKTIKPIGTDLKYSCIRLNKDNKRYSL